MKLTDSIEKIKGIGEKSKTLYDKMGVVSVEDLLYHFPRGYDEWKDIAPIRTVQEGDTVAIEGFFSARPQVKIKGRFKLITGVFQDSTGNISVTWYNMMFLRNQLKVGARYILRGKVSRKRGQLILEQPKIISKEEFYKNVGRLQPVYPLTAGLTNRAVTKAVEYSFRETDELLEFLPKEIRDRNELWGYRKALKGIHFPENKAELRKARERLVFDELFLYQLALHKIRKNGKNGTDYVLCHDKEMFDFTNELPFTLTQAQNKVLAEIVEDLKSGYVMNRLVQGDVGSGKTIVAVAALYGVALDHVQGAFMVPTEVLATQHYKSLQGLLQDKGIKVGLLTGSMTAKEKREAREAIAAGQWDIVVGTHAIIQEQVKFHDLRLVITDEQHRFGVKQRETLFEKGKEPHVLAMSATPIPRTLALMLYGDMDLSVMDEKPADRLPIKNCVVDTSYRDTAYDFMKKQIGQGHQVYIICPMVEESENSELENVAIYTEELKACFPPGVCIEGLHGKMKPKQKDDIMTRFGNGEIQILVSTTVIEVGIDVPNATVIMIENAERFGLAQLHQLRGRVGRGDAQSYCILMTGNASKESAERLSVLAQSNDGFEVAKKDLEMRGQGDLFGVRQSGQQIFALADIIQDADVLTSAAREAKKISEDDLEKILRGNERLKNKVSSYLGQVVL